MSDLLGRVQALVRGGAFEVTLHGARELAADGTSA
jgi:hypothetical protein